MADAAAVASVSPPGPEGDARPLPATLVRSVGYKFVIYGLNAVTGIVTARALNPAGRGQLAAIVLWPVLLAGLSTVGLPSALVYHMRRTPQRVAVLVGCALVMSAAAGLIATVLGWYLVPLWLAGQPDHVIGAARFCIVATTAIYAQTMVTRAVWEAKGRLDHSHLLQVISPALTVIALVIHVALGGVTPRSAALVYILAGVPAVLWSLLSIARELRPTLREARGTWGALTHYGARSYGVDLSATLAVYLDQALVVGLLRADAIGLYVVALNLSRVINAVQGSVALMAFPRMIGLPRPALRIGIARAARLGAIVSGAIGLVVMVSGGTVVTLLYGASFAAAGQILPILVAEVVLAGVGQVLLQGFLASGRPGVATMIQLSALCLSVPVFLLLVPVYGAGGAAAALLIGTAIRVALTIAAYPVFLRVPMPRVWIARSDIVDLAGYRDALRQSFTRVLAGATK